MEVVIQYFDGCSNWRLAEERLRTALQHLGRADVRPSRRLVGGESDAERLGFCGSPTILIDDRDPFAAPSAATTAMACRLYRTPQGLQGSPTVEQLAAVIQRAEEGT